LARKADSLIEELLAFSPRGGVDDQVGHGSATYART
jgi:hypothetical protein